MAAPNFPLRWESIGDQWWYASPIDWAAANGLYDLVRELLHLDTNLLIKLTSLRRIRRLETVWDDDECRFSGVAANRCHVARKLLLACESRGGKNSLIRAGYGGWLLYTAASAGDALFAKELLERDPLLVYGEGEYGLTDLLYGTARGRSAEVFRMLIGFAVAPPRGGGEGEEEAAEVGGELRWEVVNRAVHAAARGGNWEMLRELLEENGGDVLSFRDDQGCTVLHSASGRGQVQVVENLVKNFDIVTSTDDQGNTALHVAAYRGYFGVVKAIISASPSLITLKNNYGDTFLHMAVAGFRAPGFRRLDKLIELMKHLVRGEIGDVKEAINARNNDGRTALHMAVSENIHITLVELLMAVPSIDLNIRDSDGMTPLDLLRQRPLSASSEILIKELIAAGGISNCRDHRTRNALVSHLKMRGIGTSPGTSFRIPDAEIFLYTGIDNVSEASCEHGSMEFSTFSGDLSQSEPSNVSNNKSKKTDSVNKAVKRLNFFLRWPKRKEKKAERTGLADNDSLDSFNRQRDFEDCHIPLRQIYAKPAASGPNNRRMGTYAVDSMGFPSPSTKLKFAAGLMHGVIKTMPHFESASPPSMSVSNLSSSSPQRPRLTSFRDKQGKRVSVKKTCGSSNQKGLTRHESLDEKLIMNEYFCFGAQGLDQVEDALSCNGKNNNHNYRNSYGSVVA